MGPKLPNREGTPVDAVPFLVVSVLGGLVCFSFGPGYLLAFGVALTPALCVSGAVAAGVAAAAFHRYVWTARPDLRSEVPVESRLRRLLYGVLVGALLVVLLMLPLWAA